MEQKRLLAIDPGAKRIGVAISDLGVRLARPFCIINHISRSEDAQRIIKLVQENDIGKIILGLSSDEDGQPSLSGRGAMRLANEIKNLLDVPIIFWDEQGTTNLARDTIIQMGVRKKKRKGHHDDRAAAILLQSFIESDQ